MIRMITMGKSGGKQRALVVIGTRHFADTELAIAEGIAKDLLATVPGAVFVDLYQCADVNSPSTKLLSYIKSGGYGNGED